MKMNYVFASREADSIICRKLSVENPCKFNIFHPVDEILRTTSRVVSRGWGGGGVDRSLALHRGTKVAKTQGKALAGLRSTSPVRAGVHPAFWPLNEI